MSSRHAELLKKYHLLIIFDKNLVLDETDADSVYEGLTKLSGEKRDVLLVLHSPGGEVEPAYLISKVCKEYSKEKFVCVVPRRAKSAASLICCGADEIHMGSMSELGPIDPQIGGYPALGLKDSLQQLAQLTETYPESSRMFAQYLSDKLRVLHIGYYERIAQSSVQYAERLLALNPSKMPTEKIKHVASRLVHGFKDHGFVIDKMEAREIFGKEVVMTNTDEYRMGNEIYRDLARLEMIADQSGFNFAFSGTVDSAPLVLRKRPLAG